MMKSKKEADLIAEYEKEINAASNGMQWYIVTAVTGKEEMVMKDIYDKLVGYNFSNRISKIEVIKEDIVKKEIFDAENVPNTINRKQKGVVWNTIELGNGKFKYEKTKVVSVNKYPGYIFINCIMDDEVWYVIRNTVNVTGVVGSSGRGVKPMPISDEEFNRMKSNVTKIDEPEIKTTTIMNGNNSSSKPIQTVEIDYNIGDTVEIYDGTEVTVENIDFNKGKVTVSMDILGGKQTLVYDLKQVKSRK